MDEAVAGLGKKDRRIRISMDVRSVQSVEEAVQWVRKEWGKIDQFDDDIFNALGRR